MGAAVRAVEVVHVVQHLGARRGRLAPVGERGPLVVPVGLADELRRAVTPVVESGGGEEAAALRAELEEARASEARLAAQLDELSLLVQKEKSSLWILMFI